MAEIQDEPFDPAAEGVLSDPDELALEQDREDRLAAESQTKTAAAEVEGEEFEYETPDGKVVRLSAEQAEAVQSLLDAEERAASLEAENKALKEKPAEAKPVETKPVEPDAGDFEPVQWDVVGDNFQAMLEGEKGGAAAIGPALHDVVLRTIATDPIIADVVGRYIDYRVSQREQGLKAETSFKDFVGDEPTEAEVAAFRKDNPWATTKVLATLGVKNARETARLNQEIADLKAGKPAAEKAAKAKGAEETVRSMKAKGTLRRVTTGRTAPAGAPQGKPRTENELIQKQVAKIQAMRQGN
ncbi:MAG: hypothetical protein WC600_18400 [Desulfobaccales bacterium]